MENKQAKIARLKDVLKSPEITNEYRKAIEDALNDGSDEAIESVWPPYRTATNPQKEHPTSPQVHK